MVLVHYIPDHLIRVSTVRDGVKRLLRPNAVDELLWPGKHCGQEGIGVSMKLERRVGLESQLKLNNAEWLPRPFHTASDNKQSDAHLTLIKKRGASLVLVIIDRST